MRQTSLPNLDCALPSTGDDMPLIDAIKGVACLVIVAHHFALYGPLVDGAEVLAPRVFAWFAQHGRLAVQVFLVVSGFLASASLAPNGLLRDGRPMAHISRRYMRLAPLYLIALTLTVLVSDWARPWLGEDLVPAEPTLASLIAHGLLLQDLLGQEALSAGVWYIAIDFQLFCMALVMFVIGKKMRAPAAGMVLVATLTLASLMVLNVNKALDVTALYFFGSYGLGMLTWWIGRIRQPARWWLSVLAITLVSLAALCVEWRSRIALALAVALALSLAQRAGLLTRSGIGLVVKLGRISYALFLVHFPILLCVSAADWRWIPEGPWIHLAGLALAFALSVALALMLHKGVERRRPGLAAGSLMLASFVGIGIVLIST